MKEPIENKVSPAASEENFGTKSLPTVDDEKALEVAYAPLILALKICGIITGPMIDNHPRIHTIYAGFLMAFSVLTTVRMAIEMDTSKGFSAEIVLNGTCLVFCIGISAIRLTLVYHSFTGVLGKLSREISQAGFATDCQHIFIRTRKIVNFILFVDLCLMTSNAALLLTLWITNTSLFSIENSMKLLNIPHDLSDGKFILLLVLAAFLQFVIDSSWHFSFALVAAMVYTIAQQFHAVRYQTEEAIENAEKNDSNIVDLERHRRNWLTIAANVDAVNLVFRHVIWVFLLFHFVGVTTILFSILNAEESSSLVFTFLQLLWFSMAGAYLILCVRVLSKLNIAAHSFLVSLYRVQLTDKQLSPSSTLSLQLFISSQTNQVVGASVLGMFPITPVSIFNVLTALVSYFLLLISFKGAAPGPASSDHYRNASAFTFGNGTS